MATSFTVNVVNGAVTETRDLNCNSAAFYKGKEYAGRKDGLVTLGGNTDNGKEILAWLNTPASNFTIPHPKRLRKVYTEFWSDGNLQIIAGDYNRVITGNNIVKQHALSGDRRYHSPRWEFSITNVAGSDFMLISLSVLFVVLTRSRDIGR